MNATTSKTFTAKPLSHKGNDYYQAVQNLTAYIESNPTFDKIVHPSICTSFGLPYMPKIFAKVYHDRMLDTIREHGPVTAATISKLTGLPHKYVCQIKRQQCRDKLIYVNHLGKCPTTGSLNIQMLAVYE